MPLVPQLQTLEVNLRSITDAPSLFTALPPTIVNLCISLIALPDDKAAAIELLRLIQGAVSHRQVNSDLTIESWEDDAVADLDKSKTQIVLPSLRSVELPGWDPGYGMFSKSTSYLHQTTNYLRRRGVELATKWDVAI